MVWICGLGIFGGWEGSDVTVDQLTGFWGSPGRKEMILLLEAFAGLSRFAGSTVWGFDSSSQEVEFLNRLSDLAE